MVPVLTMPKVRDVSLLCSNRLLFSLNSTVEQMHQLRNKYGKHTTIHISNSQVLQEAAPMALEN